MSITIQALGRPYSLGQLYNAVSSNPIPGFNLFGKSDAAKPDRTSVASTDIKYEEVKGVKEKTRALNVSAQLSLSILSGAVDISGMGSYLSNSSESSDSTTIVCVGQYRTFNESLDVNKLLQSQAMNAESLARMGATHVVTSITYGGNIVGSLTQKNELSSSEIKVAGKFNLEVLKTLGAQLGGGGGAELSVDSKKKLNSYNLNVQLTADFFSKGEQLPSNAAELLETFKKSSNLIGDGVPCEISLTPLAWLHSGIPSFQELADADILELTDLYDSIVLLGQNRTSLSTDALAHKGLFPTFLKTARERNSTVSRLVQQARQELRQFLEANRSQKADAKSPIDFLDEIEGRFQEARELYEKDYDEWLSKMERVRAAKKHDFPPAAISELRGILSGQVNGVVAIILIPETMQYSKLLSTYRELAEDIRNWRSSLDKSADDEDHTETKYITVFLDESLDKDLLKLDDDTKSVATALKLARDDATPVFLTFGRTRDTLSQLKWSLVNQEGWGVLVNHAEGWRYIGDVHNGLRHGSGVITYADGSVYQGGWFGGKRDGNGELFPPQARSATGALTGGEKGVYINNVRVYDGVVVKVTVYRDGSPIQFGRIALRKDDATVSQVDKIGKVFGWPLDQKYELKIESVKKTFNTIVIPVKGTVLDPEVDKSRLPTTLPLGEEGEVVITAVARGKR